MKAASRIEDAAFNRIQGLKSHLYIDSDKGTSFQRGIAISCHSVDVVARFRASGNIGTVRRFDAHGFDRCRPQISIPVDAMSGGARIPNDLRRLPPRGRDTRRPKEK